MLSRVGERIYWMARYVERAENTARLTNVTANLLLDLPRRVTLGWQPLIDMTGSGKDYRQLFRHADEPNVVRFLIADLRNGGSLLSSLHLARENARTIRDIIPREAWESLNRLYLQVKSRLPGALVRKHRHDFLNTVISGAQELTGLLAGTMLNNAGYSFLRMGRNLERADMTTRIVDISSANLIEETDNRAFENIQWMSVLRTMSAYQGYRQKVQGQVQRGSVLDFLMKEAEFPRSFVHCISEVRNYLQQLPHNQETLTSCDVVLKLVDGATFASMKQPDLHIFIDDLQLGLGNLHNAIANRFFAPPDLLSKITRKHSIPQ